MTFATGEHGNTTWPESRIDLLTRLWIKGASCSAIAAEIGGISRNAVIGKVSRLKLNLQYPRALPRGPLRKRRVETSYANNFALLRARKAADQRARRLGETVPKPAPIIEVPSVPCSLLELSDSRCRWPVGDPGSDGFHFCGANIRNPPYCSLHKRAAHLPAKQKYELYRSVPFVQKKWSGR